MQRFKPGDAVRILPQFAHLYSDRSGVIVGVTADPFRPIFNEYTLQFSDSSIARVLEFQLIREIPNFETAIAVVTFDSLRNLATVQMRGQSYSRQVIFQAAGFDIDIRMQISKSRASLIGQVLERSTSNLLKEIDVLLIKAGMPIHAIESDNLGIFQFRAVPRGALNLVVVIPQKSLRFLADLSI